MFFPFLRVFPNQETPGMATLRCRSLSSRLEQNSNCDDPWNFRIPIWFDVIRCFMYFSPDKTTKFIGLLTASPSPVKQVDSKDGSLAQKDNRRSQIWSQQFESVLDFVSSIANPQFHQPSCQIFGSAIKIFNSNMKLDYFGDTTGVQTVWLWRSHEGHLEGGTTEQLGTNWHPSW